jgi:tRNA A-37 threonylcarbamoyl transferase component Bud32
MAASGEQIGAYRLVSRLGAGGMGEVWLAEHGLLGRRAAIKLLHPMFSRQPEIVTRFFNEARAATSIADPGIVQIFDFGHHDGSAYIVMEALEGETLDARCRRLGVIPLGEALRIIRQVASSLGAAHARGIVHRDLKPENIFLVRDPEVASGERPKILDFGIAKLGGDAHLKTSTSAVMGTPTFMSPEQCRGAGQVDARADVYSLGCVLFAMLVGRPPFEADGAGELIAMHLREPAPRASSRATGIPAAIDDLVARCLEKRADDRFASGAELAAALGALLTDPGPRPGLPTTLSGAAMQRASHGPRRSMAQVLAVGAIAIVGLGSWWAFHPGSSPTPAASIEPPAPPAPVPAPAPAPVPAPADAPAPRADDAIRAALTAFVAWAIRHPGAACPRIAELGVAHAFDDPWGHAVAITCTDQPANEIAGAISAGSDGVFGTTDDVASWTLDREVTSIVRGPRWTAKPAHTRAASPPPAPVQAAAPTPPPPPPESNFDTQLNRARAQAKHDTKVEPVQ